MKARRPDLFDTNQGSQLTSDDFADLLKKNNMRISMDGKGSWKDNVFIERLWKSVKHEDVYIKVYSSIAVARKD